ncbi:hypothetical protein E8L90_29655 [Brevibacillus antibioticus]|uniref:Uncharacterized protein n=1 Tax=Brevibacillus antibioticus TaxID=2570228 RepID=A0A4V5TI90_9BACL|nr:hypothetical protein [Brevibacillus antibioticus]TKI52923.1 hypothetical protein E8L90_29655 [Brevibacillus antibioticus]
MPVVPKGLATRKLPLAATAIVSATSTGGITIKKIAIFNSHTSNVTFYATKQINSVVYNLLEIVLAPKETAEWTDPTHLNNGDVLRCYASVDNVLNIDVWGLELS